jgi:hypothetical protein
MGIEGSVLDPHRTVGVYEQKAQDALGEPLVHIIRDPGDERRRWSQIDSLYNRYGWQFSDIGKAFGFSRQWVRMLYKDGGGEVNRPVRNARPARPE